MTRLSRTNLAVLGAFVLVGIFSVERSAPQDDGSQYWVMAGRMASSDSPLYVSAVDHKGPLWAYVYRFAFAISGDQRWFWFIIAALFVALALAIGWCVVRIVTEATGSRTTGRVAAATVTWLIIFGPDDYSLSLYGRNITSALTALAAVFVVGRLSRSTGGWPGIVAAAVLLGLATQTVLTTAAPTVALAAGLALMAPNRRLAVTQAAAIVAIATGVVLLAPLWYSAQGAGEDFWLYWWNYNQLYATANPAPILNRALDAVRELSVWAVTRVYPLIAVAALWVLGRRLPRDRSGFRDWELRERIAVVVALWWLSELVAVVAPNRFFDHYWILTLAPTALLGAIWWNVLADGEPAAAGGAASEPSSSHFIRAGRAFDALSLSRKLIALPILGMLLISLPSVLSGAQLLANYRGPDAHLADRATEVVGAVGAIRGVVETVVPADGEVFVWGPAADSYSLLNRRAASRFDRRQWLTGEVLGGENLVLLPNAWENLLADLEESQPKLIMETLDWPIGGESPLAGLIREHYTIVYESAETLPVRLYARRNTPLLREAPGPEVRCWFAPELYTGTIRLTGPNMTATLAVTDQQVVSRRGPESTLGELGDTAHVVRSGLPAASLVVGPDSAVLWDANDTIIGAMHLPHGIDRVFLEGEAEALRSQPCV